MDYITTTKKYPVVYQRVKGNPKYSEYTLGNSVITSLHYHNLVELGVCLSGSGIAHIGDKEYTFKQGDVQSIARGVKHLSTSDQGVKSKWIFLSFDPKELLMMVGITDPEGALSLTDNDNIVCGIFDKNKYSELSVRIEELVRIAKNFSGDFDNKLELAFAVGNFLLASKKLKSGEKNIKELTVQNKNVIMDKAIDYINENLDDNLALSEKSLANFLGISTATLSRLFIQNTNYPPKTFIMRSRMAVAEWLIISSGLSVTEIAVRVGYSDTSGFNRIFKKHFNLSPAKYRKANKKT